MKLYNSEIEGHRSLHKNQQGTPEVQIPETRDVVIQVQKDSKKIWERMIKLSRLFYRKPVPY